MRVNELELRYVGVMRSGGHTVIEWILSLYPREKLCLLDMVRHGAVDPYTSAREVVHLGFDDDAPLDDVRNARKRLLLYAYEDRPSQQQPGKAFLDSVFDPEFEQQRETHLGSSDRQRNLIVLRDPFSCLASRLMVIRKRGAKGGSEELAVIAENWKALAKRALKNLDDDRGDIVILYNRWICDAAYRKKLAGTLAGHYSEKRFNEIYEYSRGRSGQKIRNWFRRKYRGTYMGVIRLMGMLSRSKKPVIYNADADFQRWQVLRRDEQFRELFKDRELLDLCEELFGDIPGGRRFVNQVTKRSTDPLIEGAATATPEA